VAAWAQEGVFTRAFTLTESFRFGPAVAAVANAVLFIKVPTRTRFTPGLHPIHTRPAPDARRSRPRVIEAARRAQRASRRESGVNQV
jgi:hypothetical protein